MCVPPGWVCCRRLWVFDLKCKGVGLGVPGLWDVLGCLDVPSWTSSSQLENSKWLGLCFRAPSWRL